MTLIKTSQIFRGVLPLAATLLIAFSAIAQDNQKFAQEADKIHRKILTIDTHNDTALRINNPNSKPGGANPQVSFQKMKDGGWMPPSLQFMLVRKAGILRVLQKQPLLPMTSFVSSKAIQKTIKGQQLRITQKICSVINVKAPSQSSLQ